MATEEVTNNSDSTAGGISLSAEQAKLLYWMIGLAPIAKALTPFVTYWASRKNEIKKNLPDAQTNAKLYHHVVEDVGRQLVTCTLQFFSYFIGGGLASGLLGILMPATGVASKTSEYIFTQVAASLAREGSTVLGRAVGTPQLIDLLEQEQNPQKNIPTKGKFANWVNTLINHHFRDPVSGNLKASKAAAFYSIGTAVYLIALVGIMQGISKLCSMVRNSLIPPPPPKIMPVVRPVTPYTYMPYPRKEGGVQSVSPWSNPMLSSQPPFNFSSIIFQR